MLDKPFKIGGSLINTGLLKHDFREPDFIGIAAVAPGHGALVLIVPVEQVGLKITVFQWIETEI